jgi:hypothetical protein
MCSNKAQTARFLRLLTSFGIVVFPRTAVKRFEKNENRLKSFRLLTFE